MLHHPQRSWIRSNHVILRENPKTSETSMGEHGYRKRLNPFDLGPDHSGLLQLYYVDDGSCLLDWAHMNDPQP